jgi:hypothetical protein
MPAAQPETKRAERARLMREIRAHELAGYPEGVPHQKGFKRSLKGLSITALRRILEDGEGIASKETA